MNTNEVVRQFAQANRLKAKRAEDDALTIYGKSGAIFPHDADLLACYIVAPSMRARTARIHKCVIAGMVVSLAGDDNEALMLFDPLNPAQVATALQVARIKKRRIATAAQRVVLASGRAARRATHV